MTDTASADLRHPRDRVLDVIQRIYRYRMTTTSGGNISTRDEAGNIWITPARVDKGALVRDDIVCVRPDGTTDGRHPASSEFPFHRAIYRKRPDVNAVVHAHPNALVAFSVCGQVPDTRMFRQAYHTCGRVGFADYRLPGSESLGESIAATFGEGCDSVILENHGVVVGGPDLDVAFQRFEAFEFAARIEIEARRLGKVQTLSDEQLSRDIGPTTPPEPQPSSTVDNVDREQRRQLVAFLRRGCEGRLLISTEGSFSARVGEDAFVVTPTGYDRERLSEADLVRVDGGRPEPGKNPSRAAAAHRAVYQTHPEIGAVVFAHPVHATAFSVTQAEFDVRTIPESYVFLRDVRRAPYGMQYDDVDRLATYVDAKTPGVLLQNDGVMIAASDVLDAFDRLEVLEATAQAICTAAPLGPIRTMNQDVIDELSEAFGLV